MTGEKNTDLSTRLGVKRSKPISNKIIITPPKAAVASSKPKKDEIQRRENPFNDMLNHRSSKEKESRKRTSSFKRAEGEGEQGRSGSADGWSRESAVNTRAAERIAELERALNVARDEHETLRKELAKVREHDINVYQQESPHYHPHRSFNHHYHGDETTDQHEDLRAKVAQLQDQVQAQEVAYQSRLQTEADWYEITSRLHATEKESQERLQQLMSLKSSISALTRTEMQVTDSALTESLTQLANRVREFVITNFRRAKLDFSNLTPDVVRALEAVSPTYLDIQDRLGLYQALISIALMHIFHEPILIGLPESGPLASVRQLATHLHDVDIDYREWRRGTIHRIENCDGNTIQREKDRLMHQLAGEVAHQLYMLTSLNLSQIAQVTLERILNAAAELQRTLLLQKAHYRMCFFRNQDDREIYFDGSRMESIDVLDGSLDEDGDVVPDRKFAFCVFPCLEKFGDEYGEHADVRNVLLRARVRCGAE